MQDLIVVKRLHAEDLTIEIVRDSAGGLYVEIMDGVNEPAGLYSFHVRPAIWGLIKAWIWLKLRGK